MINERELKEYQTKYKDDNIVIQLDVLKVWSVDVTGWVTEHAQRRGAELFAKLNGINAGDPCPLVDFRALNEDGRDFVVYGAKSHSGLEIRPFGAVIPAAFFESGWENTWDSKIAWVPVCVVGQDGKEHLKVIRVILQKAY